VTGDLAGRRDLLRHIEALAGLDEPRLDALARLVGERTAPAGEVIVRQGDPTREVYLVVRGEVEVQTDGRAMARLGPGAVVGEVALLVDGPRMSTVVATEDLELLVLDAEAFTALLDEPEVARVLASELAQRLRALPPPDAGSARDTTSWDALTPAEQQVARLVAEGLTNGAVAERLFLSRHTVESHLKHIFTKLGIRSRVALAVDVVPPATK
jgi:CRP-like cAMP-binding protein